MATMTTKRMSRRMMSTPAAPPTAPPTTAKLRLASTVCMESKFVTHDNNNTHMHTPEANDDEVDCSVGVVSGAVVHCTPETHCVQFSDMS